MSHADGIQYHLNLADMEAAVRAGDPAAFSDAFKAAEKLANEKPAESLAAKAG